MQISKETPVKITLWFIATILALVSSWVAMYYSIVNKMDRIDLINERQDKEIQKILDLDLDSRLTKMQTDLDWIKAQY